MYLANAALFWKHLGFCIFVDVCSGAISVHMLWAFPLSSWQWIFPSQILSWHFLVLFMTATYCGTQAVCLLCPTETKYRCIGCTVLIFKAQSADRSSLQVSSSKGTSVKVYKKEICSYAKICLILPLLCSGYPWQHRLQKVVLFLSSYSRSNSRLKQGLRCSKISL
jgi:hypothetical protein